MAQDPSLLRDLEQLVEPADIYPPGVKVSDREVAEIDLRRDRFHGDWNYTLHPRRH